MMRLAIRRSSESAARPEVKEAISRKSAFGTVPENSVQIALPQPKYTFKNIGFSSGR